MTETPDSDTYALTSGVTEQIPVPDLPYQPPAPRAYAPRIGIIGAGGIAPAHLDAYRTAGWTVAAICDRDVAKARDRGAEFFPDARLSDDAETLLSDDSLDVLDITLHPAARCPMIEAAIRAGKHVLSQKPFVLDLDEGARLADLADAHGVKLAVNQNGRWSPHMAWMRAAVQGGLIGDVLGCHAGVHWDHSWIVGTPFEAIEDLILYDFGIHWFDFVETIMPGRAESAFASAAFAQGQTAKVPLMAQAQIAMTGGQASLVFDGATPHGPRDTIYISGTKGSLKADGPDLGQQTVTLTTPDGSCSPTLSGQWFNDGFRGSMGSLLVAIEDDTVPSNAARANLDSLALAFAAIASRQSGAPVVVGQARAITV